MKKISNFDSRVIQFESYSDAAIVLDTLMDLADKYDTVTVNDFCDAATIQCHSKWKDDVWAKDVFAHVKVLHDFGTGGYYIDLPRPLSADQNKTKRIPYNRKYIEKEKEPMEPIRPTGWESPDFELTPIDEETIAYQKQVQEIKEASEKKIQKIKEDTARKLYDLQKARKIEEDKACQKEQAEFWKRKYDAFIAAGFNSDEALMFTMKAYEVD